MTANQSKAKPGQKAIDTRTWNSMCDMLDWWKRTQQMGSSVAPPQVQRPTDTIRIRNDTEEALPKYSVLRPGAYLLSELNPRRLFYAGVKPTVPGAFVGVLQWTAGQGDIIEAQVSGVCPVRVDVTDITHTHASVVEDETDLTSNTAGPFRMLGTRTSTGVQEVVCVIDATGGSGDDFYYSTTGLSGGTYHSFNESASNAALIATTVSHATDSTAWEIDNSNNVLICKKPGAWTVHASLIHNATAADAETTVYLKLKRSGVASTIEQGKRMHPVVGGSGPLSYLDSVCLFSARDFELEDQLYLQCATDSASTASYQLDCSFLLTRIS